MCFLQNFLIFINMYPEIRKPRHLQLVSKTVDSSSCCTALLHHLFQPFAAKPSGSSRIRARIFSSFLPSSSFSNLLSMFIVTIIAINLYKRKKRNHPQIISKCIKALNNPSAIETIISKKQRGFHLSVFQIPLKLNENSIFSSHCNKYSSWVSAPQLLSPATPICSIAQRTNV